MSRPTNEAIHADCERIASVAQPADTLRDIVERCEDAGMGLSRDQTARRVRAMRRALGLDPPTAAEVAAARFRATEHRAGVVVTRWRRHYL